MSSSGNGKKSVSGSNSASVTPASTPVTTVAGMTNGQTATQTSPPPNNAPKYGPSSDRDSHQIRICDVGKVRNVQKSGTYKTQSLYRVNTYPMHHVFPSNPEFYHSELGAVGTFTRTRQNMGSTHAQQHPEAGLWFQGLKEYRELSPDINNNTLSKKNCTLVPNRIFVGGISANTTEAELLALFSNYGQVKAAKIIQDRAGVSKGYGFITFESEDDARRLQRESDNIVLRERKLNIAPAIKKQPFSRAFDAASPPAVAAGNPPYFFQPGAMPFYHQSGVTYYPPQPTAPGDPSAQQPVYQPPSVYQAQSGPPQSATYQPAVMFPAQPIYVPQQYTIPMPYDYTTFYPNNGPQYMVGGQGGSQPQIPTMQRPGSPPRQPCYGQQLPYNADTVYYNVPLYNPMEAPAAVYPDALDITTGTITDDQQHHSENSENVNTSPSSDSTPTPPQPEANSRQDSSYPLLVIPQNANYFTPNSDRHYPLDCGGAHPPYVFPMPENVQNFSSIRQHYYNQKSHSYNNSVTNNRQHENGLPPVDAVPQHHNTNQRLDRNFNYHQRDFYHNYNSGYGRGRYVNNRGGKQNRQNSSSQSAESHNGNASSNSSTSGLSTPSSNPTSEPSNVHPSQGKRTRKNYKRPQNENGAALHQRTSHTNNNNVNEAREKLDGLKL